MTKNILEWAKKHYILSFIIICAILGGVLSPSDEANKQDNINNNQNKIVNVELGESASSIEEILSSQHKSFFESNGLNIELKTKIKKELLNENIEIIRAQFFTTDDKKQILVNTIFKVNGKEYASNSRHNIKTNIIEEFYYNEVK